LRLGTGIPEVFLADDLGGLGLVVAAQRLTMEIADETRAVMLGDEIDDLLRQPNLRPSSIPCFTWFLMISVLM
jgi:hypothetical protein